VDAYRIKRNNLIFDEHNTFKFKLPTKPGKNYATRSFTQDQPSDAVKLRVNWNADDGMTITSV